MFEVADDSGFLAVVVPAAYESFVDRDWKIDQLFDHLRRQMLRQSLLIWGTGLEGFWKVEIALGKSPVHGFREVSGRLRVVGGRVLVTNYESLTMAAQFEDVRLPERHHEKHVVSVADGDYCCRIVQMFDPDQPVAASGGKPDFVVELNRTHELPEAWSEVPWFTA